MLGRDDGWKDEVGYEMWEPSRRIFLVSYGFVGFGRGVWGLTYFDCAATPFRCPFAAFETDPVALAPGPFAYAEDWVELAGYAEVEVESWGWEVVGWGDPVLGWGGFGGHCLVLLLQDGRVVYVYL